MYISNIEKYSKQLFGLIKITNHVESLLDGTIYMNNLEEYIQMEKESGIKGIGDKLEASHVFSNLTFEITHPKTGDLIKSGSCSQMNFKYNGDGKKPVYCMFALHGGLLKIIDEDQDYYYTELDLGKFDVKKIVEEFGNKMVFVNSEEFIRRLLNKFDENHYSYRGDLVKYDNFNRNSTKRLEAYWNMENEIYFWKDEYFSNQHEYRIVITNKEIEHPLIVNIGDIRDISSVFSVDEFFNGNFSMKFKK